MNEQVRVQIGVFEVFAPAFRVRGEELLERSWRSSSSHRRTGGKQLV